MKAVLKNKKLTTSFAIAMLLVSCKSSDKKIAETHREISETYKELNEIRDIKTIAINDSLRNNDTYNMLNPDSLELVNDSLYNDAKSKYIARISHKNRLSKFFNQEQIKEIRRTLRNAIKKNILKPTVIINNVELPSTAYESAQKILNGVGSIYDFLNTSYEGVYNHDTRTLEAISAQVDPQSGMLLFDILWLQEKISIAEQEKNLYSGYLKENYIKTDIEGRYTIAAQDVIKEIHTIQSSTTMDKAAKSKRLVVLNKELNKYKRYYGIIEQNGEKQILAAQKYRDRNNAGLINQNANDVPNFDIPEMKAIRDEWVKNKNLITSAHIQRDLIYIETKEHFDNEHDSATTELKHRINVLETKRQELIDSKLR